MNKKGLSGVVTTLILILLSLVAVGVIWVVISNIISQGAQDVDIGKFTVDVEVVKVLVNGDGTIGVVVHRNVGEGDVTKLKFVINNGTNTYSFEEDVSINELETKTVNLVYSGLIKSIGIAPLFSNSNVGQASDYELREDDFENMGFIRYSNNPVFSRDPTSSWENLGVVNPIIVKNLDGSIYHDVNGYWMYYTGMTYDFNATGAPKISLDQFGLARSQDLINWNRVQSTPVMSINLLPSYEHGDVQVSTVLHNGTHFLAWYAANQYLLAEGSDNVTINFASSIDGINWDKYSGNPILAMGSGNEDDNNDTYLPIVIYDEGIWKMWYSGHRENLFGIAVMYATALSPQGPWTKYSPNYIYSNWRPYNMVMEVYKDNGKYYMHYINWTRPDSPMNIRLASSPNGINWEDEGVIFDVGSLGSWEEDIVYHTSQAKVGDIWYTFYTGSDDGYNWEIGLATSFVRTPQSF